MHEARGSASRPIQVTSGGDSDSSSNESSSGKLQYTSAEPDEVSRDTRVETQYVEPQEDRHERGLPRGAPQDASPGISIGLKTLRSTRVPRSLWIPGFLEPRAVQAEDIKPWDASVISTISASNLTGEYLFKHLPIRSTWLFPKRGRRPPAFATNLITGSQIAALLEARPWDVLGDRPEVPSSFNRRDMPSDLLARYEQYEDQFLQEYWKSTQFLWITKEDCRRDPGVDAYYRDRKKRRTDAGQAWREVLDVLAAAMQRGLFDLDFLLDPFFLHFPNRQEEKFWYPVVAPADSKSPSLLKSLHVLDEAQPWRNQFRINPSKHPAEKITRLGRKFCPR